MVELKEGKIVQKRPYIYQMIDGKRVMVEGKFKIQNSVPESSFIYGFEIASYNKEYPLIIDPILVYSTYLGGSSHDIGGDIAVDSVGNVYIIGYTVSNDFPLAFPIQGIHAGMQDVFVTKINASGNSLVYSTYLGGGNFDIGLGITVDSSQNIYITGYTYSTDFPTFSPIQGAKAGENDVFVTKINASGNSLVYSTYLGGSGEDRGFAIAVDSSGNAYVTGHTMSYNFPTASPLKVWDGTEYWDAFVTKINATGNSIIYSTYFGGSSADKSNNIAVDSSGNIYITGFTLSDDYPIVSPVQMGRAGHIDAFITKINSSGSGVVYSTYLGGSSEDSGMGIAVDSSGNAFLTGYTASTDFPLASAIQWTNAGLYDAFAAKISASGSSLVYSTYLGGSGSDGGHDIAVNSSGNAYITGSTSSTDFPTVLPIQGSYGGGDGDAFMSKINVTGNYLNFSTFLGGSGFDTGIGIAIDNSSNVYIIGDTSSYNFPVASPIQGTFNGPGWVPDIFVSKISTSALTGCIQLHGSPLGGVSVILKQTNEKDQTTLTDIKGCYSFDHLVSGKKFKVIINGPIVP